METTRFCVGIDVSKDTLSVNASARPGLGAVSVKGGMAKCPNTPAGFKELYSWALEKCAGAAPPAARSVPCCPAGRSVPERWP